jgi:hypothetical protein
MVSKAALQGNKMASKDIKPKMKNKLIKHINKDGKEFKEMIKEEKKEIKSLKGQIKDDAKLKKTLKKPGKPGKEARIAEVMKGSKKK